MTHTTYVIDRPIVIDRRPKKKRKPTRALREWNSAERHMIKAARRTVRAGDRGLATYSKGRKKARRKGVRDPFQAVVPSMVRASSVAARHVTLVPLDMYRATRTRSGRRVFRSGVRAMDAMLP